MNATHIQMTKAAAKFRSRHKLPSTGVVIFYAGKPTSWGHQLPPPQDYAPNNIALAADGTTFVTRGGNAAQGAASWEPSHE